MDPFESEHSQPKVITQRSMSWTAWGDTNSIRTHANAEEICALRISEGIKNFHPPEQEGKILAEIASNLNANVTIAFHGEFLIGYAAIEKSDPRIRWGKSSIQSLYELEALEVSRSYRNRRLARNMLELAFSDPWVEDLIVLSTEYTWHWDLEDTALDNTSYRRMLRDLFVSVGFRELETDEPNILSEPENLFMVRRGSAVPLGDWLAFERHLTSGAEEPQHTGSIVRGRHKEFWV